MSEDPWAGEGDWEQAAPLFAGNDADFDRRWDEESPARPQASVTTPTQRLAATPAAVETPTSNNSNSNNNADDDNNEDFPPPRRGRAFLGFLVVLVVLAGAALGALRWYRSQVDPPGAPGAAVNVVVPPNTPSARIGKILHAKGIIGNPTLFRYYAQYKGKGGFEAGRYQFHLRDSFDTALAVLTKGPSVPDEQKLTIPEGFRETQIAARVQEKLPGRTAEKFLAATKAGTVRSEFQPPDSTELEGFLFPETYTFALEDSEAAIVARMVETFDQVGAKVGLADSVAKVGLSPYDTLILASLVEREAKHDEDRPKIARVIYNRIKKGMPLQIDATIVYALGGVTQVLDADLKLDSPYNTYTRKGLPPTPIASPGKASLEAALNPEVGDWLYYVVTTPDGYHSFATTFKEHKANIKLAKERGVR